MAGQYADITFSDQRHFTSALHSVVAALTDPELPVRVDSVVSLRTFVEACKGMRSLYSVSLQTVFSFTLCPISSFQRGCHRYQCSQVFLVEMFVI